MGRQALVFLAAATLLLPACSQLVFRGSDGLSISARDGQLYVDDVLVQYHREVELDLDAARVSELRLIVATGLIDLTGVPGEQGHLIVDLYTEFDGDGDVTVVGGRLRAHSELRGKLVINGIRGTVPAGTSLDLDTGTGQVLISDLTDAASVEVGSGTGPIRIVDCDLGSLDLDTGTADIRLERVHAEILKVDSGTGDLSIEGGHFDHLRAESGTGDFLLRESQVESGHFESGTGDLRLLDTVVTRLHTSLGTGSVHSGSGTR